MVKRLVSVIFITSQVRVLLLLLSLFLNIKL